MSSRDKKRKDWDDDDDHRGHDNKVDLNGQAQLQGQAQGQLQFAAQSLDSKVDIENENENKNSNENENENKNENTNELKNELDNEVDNKLDNDVDNNVDNKVDNKVENSIDNKIENSIENNVEVKVDVDIDLDLEGYKPSDDDIIDIEEITDITGSVVMPDAVEQKLESGNQFNIDQVNNLVDKDWLHDPTVSAEDGKFEWDAKGDGGFVLVGDAQVDMQGDGSTFGDAVTSTADAIVSQEAFTQNIVMGANIQFNSIEMTNTVDFDAD
jgi:hypothetical protein